MIPTEILPGEGLDSIKFGLSEVDVEAVLGPADAVELIDYSGDGTELELSWRYNELGLTVGFYHDGYFRLGSLEADRQDYTFRDIVFIGKEIDTVEQNLFTLGLGDFTYEDLTTGLVQLEVEDLSLAFIISEGVCVEIQWGYFWHADGSPHWVA